MIDRFNIELTAGNKDRIAVEPWHGRVSIFVVDGSGSVEGEAHVVMEPAECDALIAAIGRALGRPAPTSTPYAPSEDLRFIEPLCAALVSAGATQEQALAEITKAMQDYRAKAVKLALEQMRPMVVVLDGGRPAPTSTPLEERLLALATEEDRLATKADWPDSHKYERAAEAYRAALAMVREQGATVPRAGVAALRDTLLEWEKACAKSEYDDGRASAILDCVGVIDTMLGTKEPGHADD